MRIPLIVMTGFLGLTAMAGGIGLLSGTLSPEPGQLDGSPFSSYTVPAVALLAIGALSLAAATLLKMRHSLALRLAATTGLAIMVFEAIQVLYIDFHWLQPAYAVLGAAILALAVAKMLANTHAQDPGNSNAPLV